MASRSTQYGRSEYYVGGRRGRNEWGDISPEMFPSKYESTRIFEDPDALYNDRRDILKDNSPDIPTLTEDLPWRDTHARDLLNLWDGGARVTTDPWVSSDQYDIQFHDADPRGYLVEQPWEQYRSGLESRYRLFNYRDDGDYSIQSSMLHPNAMYKQIRDAQNWLKERFKNFGEERNNFVSAGVGRQLFADNPPSLVEKTDSEWTSSEEDQRIHDSESHDRQSSLSNMLHLGSKYLRTTDTTDHIVPIASYSTLRKSRGLDKHEHSLRVLESDVPWSKIIEVGKQGKSLARLMSSVVGAQHDRHESAAALVGEDVYNTAPERAATSRNLKFTRDIMSLLGITDAEMKYLESRAAGNNRQAIHAVAQIKDMVTTVHELPIQEKIAVRDDLLRGGLIPQNVRVTMNAAVVNPKIVSFMDMQTRLHAELPTGDRPEAIADSEGKLNRPSKDIPLYTTSVPGDSDKIRRETMDDPTRAEESRETASFASLARKAVRTVAQKWKGLDEKEKTDAAEAKLKKSMQRAGTLRASDVKGRARQDNTFGENRGLARRIGAMGTKYLRRAIGKDIDADAGDVVGDSMALPKKSAPVKVPSLF